MGALFQEDRLADWSLAVTQDSESVESEGSDNEMRDSEEDARQKRSRTV
jgi:hypothetical protein